MNRPIHFTTATLPVPNLISRSPLRRGIPVALLGLALFAFSPPSRAVTPAPDGGYPAENTAEGDDALFSLTVGHYNTACGFQALFTDKNGQENTALGCQALYYNSAGVKNTASGAFALVFNTGSDNTADGSGALNVNTTGNDNTASGARALLSNTTGNDNTANGSGALNDNTSGNNNTAGGFEALFNNATGGNNTAIGFNALLNNTKGSNNIVLGVSAGANIVTGNNNIYIGSAGSVDENNKIRIGTAGTQKQAYIAGVYGALFANGIQVVASPQGRLGTISSSAQFKEAIKPMDKASEAILALQPVTFRYKREFDPDGIPQFGLVAEQVQKVNPDLVARDIDGKVYIVRYEAVNAMLLNEFLKEHREVEQLKAIVAKEKATNAQQQKQIEALGAAVQKISDRIDLSKAIPRVVANDQ